MVNIANKLGKKFHAVITSMEQPLGRAVGNSLEVIESIEFLKGNMTPDIKELTYEMASLALVQLKKANDKKQAYEIIDNAINTGKALEFLKKLIVSQGGDTKVIDDYNSFGHATKTFEIASDKDGYVSNIDAYKTAYACKLLGAGREKKTDSIDYSAGVFLRKIYSEPVKKGETIAVLYANDDEKLKQASVYLKDAFTICEDKPDERNMVYKII